MLVLLLFFSRGLPFLRLENLFTFDPHYLVLPYGAVLFSLWGLSLVPQVKEMTGGERKTAFNNKFRHRFNRNFLYPLYSHHSRRQRTKNLARRFLRFRLDCRR